MPPKASNGLAILFAISLAVQLVMAKPFTITGPGVYMKQTANGYESAIQPGPPTTKRPSLFDAETLAKLCPRGEETANYCRISSPFNIFDYDYLYHLLNGKLNWIKFD